MERHGTRIFLAVLGLLSCVGLAQAQEMQSFTDDLGRQIQVPVHPRRIVSLHDLDITIPLIELGVPPVASHGRTALDGKHFLRSSAILTGVDFDNSDIKFIGTANIDMEALVAAKPDLIITEPSRDTPIEQLEKIAPTVSIDHLVGDAPRLYARFAELTGTETQLAILERRYKEQIDQLKHLVDTGSMTVSVFQANKGKVTTFHTYRALGRVLRDAGFKFPEIIDTLAEGERIDVSAERLPELDADFIFDPFRSDSGGGPDEEVAEMEKVLPGYCQFLKACREGRYILLPREESISNSFAALSLMASVLQSHIGGRPQPELKASQN